MMTRRMLYIGEDEAIWPMTSHLVDVEEHGPKLRYVIHVRVKDIYPAKVLSYLSWDGLKREWNYSERSLTVMLAYKCDICGTYRDGRPAGVLYDNTTVNGKNSDRERYDLCPDCIEKAMGPYEEETADEGLC